MKREPRRSHAAAVRLLHLLPGAALLALSPSARGGSPPKEEDALDRGEILVTSHPVAGSAPLVEMKAVIEAPPSKVWAVVSQCARYPKTMPRIKAAEQLSAKGKEVICRVTVDMPFPYSDLTATTRAIHEVGDGRYSRRWELISGDYRVNRGSWQLTTFRGSPGRTLAVYRVQALPKVWIPGWIRDKAQRSSLPDMMRSLRRFSK
jgi:ribosome-associated toxin RatA of RatAB toxin-antitoxin module